MTRGKTCSSHVLLPFARAAWSRSPTETVYGLGANALDPLAVSKIFNAKGRPQVTR
jgi:hypothetical protein